MSRCLNLHIGGSQAIDAVSVLADVNGALDRVKRVVIGGDPSGSGIGTDARNEPLPALAAAALSVVLPRSQIIFAAEPARWHPAHVARAFGNLHALTGGRTGWYIDLRSRLTASDPQEWLTAYLVAVRRLIDDGPAIEGPHFRSAGRLVGPKPDAQALELFVDQRAVVLGLDVATAVVVATEARESGSLEYRVYDADTRSQNSAGRTETILFGFRDFSRAALSSLLDRTSADVTEAADHA